MKNFNNVCDVVDNANDFEDFSDLVAEMSAEMSAEMAAEMAAEKAATPAEMAAEKVAARNAFNMAHFAKKPSEKTDRAFRSETLYYANLHVFNEMCADFAAVSNGEAAVLKAASKASDIVVGTRLVIKGAYAVVVAIEAAETRESGANQRVRIINCNYAESNVLMSTLLKNINGKNMSGINASYRPIFSYNEAAVIENNDEVLENNDEVLENNVEVFECIGYSDGSDEVFECIGYSDGSDEVFECIGYSDGSDEIEYVDPDSVMELNELWVGLACTPNAIRTWISMHDRHIYLKEFGEADNIFDIITDVQRRCGFPLSTRDDRQCSIN